MSRHLNKKPAKPPTPKLLPPPHLAANLPDDPKELHTQCSGSWAGLEPLCAAGQVFAKIVPDPPTITATLKAVSDALPLAEGGDALPVATLRAAAGTLRSQWSLVTRFCEVTLRTVPAAEIPGILAQIQMTPSGAGHNRSPKPPIAAKQVGPGAVRIDVLALLGVVAYFYECSVDQTNWIPGIQTGRTDGTITGLKSVTLYYFRFKCLKADDTYTDYSTTVHLLVQ